MQGDTVQDSWGAVPNVDSEEVPLPEIGLKKTASIAILTDLNGKIAKIVRVIASITTLSLLTGRQGGFSNAASPACMISIESVTENHETYLNVLARFPSSRSPPENRPDVKQFQYMGFRFYGDAFQSFDRDFVVTPITEAEKLPDILKGDTQTVAAMVEKGDLHKLELTYQPDRVVTRDKDDPEMFSNPESHHAAKLLRYLVEGEKTKTLTIFFRAGAPRLGYLDGLRNRLLHEQKILPFQEYRDSNGKIV